MGSIGYYLQHLSRQPTYAHRNIYSISSLKVSLLQGYFQTILSRDEWFEEPALKVVIQFEGRSLVNLPVNFEWIIFIQVDDEKIFFVVTDENVFETRNSATIDGSIRFTGNDRVKLD